MVMPRFIKNDPTELGDYVTGVGRGLVIFDGRPMAGKTPLARDIARRIGCNAVDADDFLRRIGDDEFDPTRGRSFIDLLRMDQLGGRHRERFARYPTPRRRKQASSRAIWAR